MDAGGEVHASAALPSGKNPGTPRIGDCVGPRAVVGDLEKIEIYFLPEF